MTSDSVLARHLHTFFHEHLIAQRSLSSHTVPIWRRDPDILAELEAIGRRRDHVAPDARDHQVGARSRR